MRTSRQLLIVAAFALTPGLACSAAAQQNQPAAAAPGAPSAVEACNQFRNALKPPTQAGKEGLPDQARQSLGNIANAGQQGMICAHALAKYFESLRENGAKGSWSEIEKEMDVVIDTYRSLLERIEGTDGAYEEGLRAVTVLDEQIKDIVARRGKDHPNARAAIKTRDAIVAGLEKTKNLKGTLDKVLVELQSRKSEIAEAEGIKRYAIAERALEDMNEGLAKVINELTKALQEPGT
jgi:hypothetical protein